MAGITNKHGYIGRRKDGRWMAQLSLRDTEGNPKKVTFYGRTKREAQGKMEMARAQQQNGGVEIG